MAPKLLSGQGRSIRTANRASSLRKSALFRLAKAETAKRYLHLLDEVSEGVIESDERTRVLYANKAASKLLGLSRSQLLKTRLIERVHPSDRLRVKQWGEVLKRKKRDMTTYRRFKRGDGVYITLERHAKLMPDGRIISIFRDVTAQKEFEKRRDMFVSIASHELRTPLSIMKQCADLLLLELSKKPNMSKALFTLRDMEAQIHKQQELIEDMLNMSQIRAGRVQFHIDRFNLNELVAEAVAHMRQITNKKHPFIIKGKVKSPIRGDRSRLHQVFINLLSNAVKYSPPKRKIEILLKENTRWVSISIRDFGVGISKEEQKRIFRQFYRSQHQAVPGTGIGLFLSKEIVTRHHGKLTVSSKPGFGSTFTVTLPKASNNNHSRTFGS